MGFLKGMITSSGGCSLYQRLAKQTLHGASMDTTLIKMFCYVMSFKFKVTISRHFLVESPEHIVPRLRD